MLLGSNNNLVGLNSLVLRLNHYAVNKNCQNEKHGPLVFYSSVLKTRHVYCNQLLYLWSGCICAYIYAVDNVKQGPEK